MEAKGFGKGVTGELTAHPPQSPLLPAGGSLAAVYEKSGYSHSETSLAAVIYMSSEVREHPTRSCPVGGLGVSCSLTPDPFHPAGQDHHYSRWAGHQPRGSHVAAIHSS